MATYIARAISNTITGVVGWVSRRRNPPQTNRVSRPAGGLRSVNPPYIRLLHAAQELVRLRQAVREAAGVGAVAAPVGQFLGAHALLTAGGILPRQARLGFEHG